MLSKADVVAYLSGLSPLEFQDLLRELEDRWEVERLYTEDGFTKMDVRLVVEPDPALVLIDVGPRRVLVMKALREAFALDLKQVRELVDATPALLAPDMDRRLAAPVVRELESLGAVVELRPVDAAWW